MNMPVVQDAYSKIYDHDMMVIWTSNKYSILSTYRYRLRFYYILYVTNMDIRMYVISFQYRVQTRFGMTIIWASTTYYILCTYSLHNYM